MAVEIMLLFSTIISLVLLVLTGLKLAGLVNISWVWVFAPIWLPFILLTGVMLIILTVVITKTIIERRRKNVRNTRRRNQSRHHK